MATTYAIQRFTADGTHYGTPVGSFTAMTEAIIAALILGLAKFEIVVQ